MIPLVSSPSPSSISGKKSRKGKEKVVEKLNFDFETVDDFPGVISRVVASGRSFLPAMKGLQNPPSLDYYLPMQTEDVMGEALATQWQAFQSSLCIYGRFSDFVDRMKAMEAKQSADEVKINELNAMVEASRKAGSEAQEKVVATLKLHVDLAKQVEDSKARITVLEHEMAKEEKKHASELKEVKLYWSSLSRVEVIEQYAAGQYHGWDQVKERREFWEAFAELHVGDDEGPSPMNPPVNPHVMEDDVPHLNEVDPNCGVEDDEDADEEAVVKDYEDEDDDEREYEDADGSSSSSSECKSESL